MINRIAFFNRLRTYNLYTTMLQGTVDNLNAILDYWEGNKLYVDQRWLAYILATGYHEAAKKFIPIEEFGKGKGYMYGRKIKMSHDPYTEPDKLYYGRGLVQLTWYENYQSFGKILKIDLLNEPELALNIDVSIKILFTGMTYGLFTGKRLADYFDGPKEDPLNARRIINSMDQAGKIATYYESFLKCII